MERDAKSVLQLIGKHSGEWSWYQLARSNAGIELAADGKNLMRIIDGLKMSRYIEEKAGHNQSQPKYAITELGREAITSEN